MKINCTLLRDTLRASSKKRWYFSRTFQVKGKKNPVTHGVLGSKTPSNVQHNQPKVKTSEDKQRERLEASKKKAVEYLELRKQVFDMVCKIVKPSA